MLLDDRGPRAKAALYMLVYVGHGETTGAFGFGKEVGKGST